MIKRILLLAATLCTFSALAEEVKIGKCDTSQCKDYFNDYKRYAKSHIDAAAMLGDMYLNGYGTEIDKEEALDAYMKAARWGSVLGRYKAGLLLLTSEDEDDRDKGLTYLSDAAKRGHPNAIYFMGEVLSNDRYGFKNLEVADDWIAASIKSQNRNVIYVLSRLNEEGVRNAEQMPLTVAAIERAPDSLFPGNESKELSAMRLPPEDSRFEVIEVNGPNLREILDHGLALFKALPRDIHKKSTGTRIRGRDCDDVFSCSSVPAENWQRFVAYSVRTPFEHALWAARG